MECHKIMKKLINLLLSVLLLQSVLFAAVEEKTIVDRLNEELIPVIKNDINRFDLPGLSMAVVADGKIIWAKGFGYADREKKIPADTETVYRAGSISKLFNAVGIMLLEEKQKLSLDENIEKYLPAARFENPFDEPAVITLRHILSHRPGTIRECAVGHYFDDTEPSQEETARSLFGTTLAYPPGTKTKYSNSAIGLSGYVLEKVTGIKYHKYQKQFVLQPLAMNSSGFVKEKSFRDKIAKGYMRDIDDNQWEAPDFRFGYLAAANLYSSVIDMAKFVDLMCNQGAPLMQPETFGKMTTIQFEPKKTKRGFGLGFMVSQIHDETTLGHNGAVYGFSSALRVIPEKNLGAICLMNLEGANGIDDKYIQFALDIALEEMTDQKLLDITNIIEMPLSELQKLTGRYQKDDSVIWLTLQKGKLYYQSLGARKQLSAVSENEFITDDYCGCGEKISVVREQQKITGVKINNDLYARTDEQKQDEPFPWKNLVGEYGPDFNVTKVYEKDGRLNVLIEWFYEYPLTHTKDLRFDFPAGLYHGEELIFIATEGKAQQIQFSGVTFNRRN
jgi:CubicO group peptidase (beta-lactamase class C family)